MLTTYYLLINSRYRGTQKGEGEAKVMGLLMFQKQRGGRGGGGGGGGECAQAITEICSDP